VTANRSSMMRTGFTAFKPSNQKVVEILSGRKIRRRPRHAEEAIRGRISVFLHVDGEEGRRIQVFAFARVTCRVNRQGCASRGA